MRQGNLFLSLLVCCLAFPACSYFERAEPVNPDGQNCEHSRVVLYELDRYRYLAREATDSREDHWNYFAERHRQLSERECDGGQGNCGHLTALLEEVRKAIVLRGEIVELIRGFSPEQVESDDCYQRAYHLSLLNEDVNRIARHLNTQGELVDAVLRYVHYWPEMPFGDVLLEAANLHSITRFECSALNPSHYPLEEESVGAALSRLRLTLSLKDLDLCDISDGVQQSMFRRPE